MKPKSYHSLLPEAVLWKDLENIGEELTTQWLIQTKVMNRYQIDFQAPYFSIKKGINNKGGIIYPMALLGKVDTQKGQTWVSIQPKITLQGYGLMALLVLGVVLAIFVVLPFLTRPGRTGIDELIVATPILSLPMLFVYFLVLPYISVKAMLKNRWKLQEKPTEHSIKI